MDRVCPLLGLAVDRRTVIDGVDGGHRCHALSPPEPLDHRMQAQRCLTPAHERCERLIAYRSRGGALPGSGPGHGLVTTRLVLAPEPAWRGIAGRARRIHRGPIIAAAVATLVLGAAGVAVGAAVLDGRIQLGRAADAVQPSASEGLEPTGAATPGASGAPEATRPPSAPPSAASSGPPATPAPAVAPTSVPTPVPSPIPTPPPTPLPTTPPPVTSTYTVVEGDTLASIADRFGTTVEALQNLNGLEDPDEIVIGQVLTLP
jgi:LysM repeat protein